MHRRKTAQCRNRLRSDQALRQVRVAISATFFAIVVGHHPIGEDFVRRHASVFPQDLVDRAPAIIAFAMNARNDPVPILLGDIDQKQRGAASLGDATRTFGSSNLEGIMTGVRRLQELVKLAKSEESGPKGVLDIGA